MAHDEGLQLRHQPNGSKAWLFDYLKPVTSISFGAYPEVRKAYNRAEYIERRRELMLVVKPY